MASQSIIYFPTVIPITGGVYKINIHLLETKEDFIYYGETSSFSRRWKKHRKDLLEGSHHNFRLRYLYKNYKCVITFEVIIDVPRGMGDRDLRRMIEQKMVELKPDICINYTSKNPASMSTLPNRPQYKERHLIMKVSPLMGKRIVAIRDADTDQLLGMEFFAGLATNITKKKFWCDDRFELYVVNSQRPNTIVKGRLK